MLLKNYFLTCVYLLLCNLHKVTIEPQAIPQCCLYVLAPGKASEDTLEWCTFVIPWDFCFHHGTNSLRLCWHKEVVRGQGLKVSAEGTLTCPIVPCLASSCSRRHRVPVELVPYLLGLCRSLVTLEHLRWHWISMLRCLDLCFVYFQLGHLFHVQTLETRGCHWKARGLPQAFLVTLLWVTCLCLGFLSVK